MADGLGVEYFDFRSSEGSQRLKKVWESVGLVLVSGSFNFFKEVSELGVDFSKAVGSLDVVGGKRIRHTPRIPRFAWHDERHDAVGGATNFRACLGVGETVTVSSEPSIGRGICRSVGDYLDPTVFGPPQTCAETVAANRPARRGVVERASDGGVLPWGLMPSDDVTEGVWSPCVFNTEGWTRRKVSSMEVGALWDLPVGWQKKYKSVPLEELDFVGSTPGKLLWDLGSRIEGLGTKRAFSTSAEEGVGGYGLFSFPELEEAQEAVAKAAKNDDAAVHFERWDRCAAKAAGLQWGVSKSDDARTSRAFDTLRHAMLGFRSRFMWREFSAFMRKKHGLNWLMSGCPECKLDREAGADALYRSGSASWWEWTNGSTLCFWRWHPEFQPFARDGVRVYVKGPLPQYRVPQRPESDAQVAFQMASKVHKVVRRDYIGRGSVLSLTGFFPVPKGFGDIRMVYDASKSGLNDVVYAPNFAMANTDSLLDLLDCRSWQSDIDLGEMFLNFPLDRKIRPYAGVDLRTLDLADIEEDWRRWSRCFMGFTPSPYNTGMSMLWAEDIIRGDHCDPRNPFYWERVVLNLPGSADYDTTRPWVYKALDLDGVCTIAPDFCYFVDDFRPTGYDEASCLWATRRLGSMTQWLGIQEAARKRQFPGLLTGPWAGSVARILPVGVGVTVTTEKWRKTREIIRYWEQELKERPHALDRKRLERDRGFLIYVCRTYPVLNCYLKGIHLTLESWRDNRDVDGWRDNRDVDGWADFGEVTGDDLGLQLDQDGNVLNPLSDPTAPETVSAVSRMASDVQALVELTNEELPPSRVVRPREPAHVGISFLDAAASGFGSGSTTRAGLRIRFGVWGSDDSMHSSNWRELRNIVDTAEDLWEQGELTGVELFVFTDNSTAESAYYRGTSSSQTLFELVLRLKKLELRAGARIHVIHCAGKREIASGADGLSRGDLTEGIMAGARIEDFVPLHLDAVERAGEPLMEWIRDWTSCPDLEALTPEGWFSLGHDIIGGSRDGLMWMPEYKSGVRLWAPPPAAGRVAVEQLRRARHRRQTSMHVFACPRLMAYSWRKQLFKEADFVFYVPAGFGDVWPKSMYEPLLIAVCLPFIRSSPWKLRRVPKLLGMERQLRRVFKDDHGKPEPVLRELCKLPRRLDSMPPELVSKLLYHR